MRAFSVIQAKPRGGGDYLYHAESKCPSPSWIFRKEDSPLLMPCVFTEEVGHSTMEPAAVGTLPLHNTLSVMCSNYSEPPPPRPKAVILFCKCTWTWHLILSQSAEWQGFIVRQVQHDAKLNLSTKRHDKRENMVRSPKDELWINDGPWAVSTVYWKGECKEKITEENLSTARRATAPLCAQDHKVTFCKSIYSTSGPHCFSASCHPL